MWNCEGATEENDLERLWRTALLVFLMIGAGGCGDGERTGTQGPPVTASANDAVGPQLEDPSGQGSASPLDRESIDAWAGEFARIAQATVTAWDSRDLDAIRGLYTEDVIHDDARFATYREGVDEVVGIAEAMFGYQTPEVRFATSSEYGPGLIGGDGGIMVWEAYAVFGYTRESPLIEVDRLTIRDGLIAHWELLYETPTPHDVIAAYGTAWSSGNPHQVEALYEPSAVRQDAILGSIAEGLETVKATAAGFFEDHPSASFDLLLPFGAGNTHGGLFSITDISGCQVRAAVLTRIDRGKIVREEIYYEAASLLACDWLS